MIPRVAFLALSVVSACGPASPELVEFRCAERARAAAGPTGSFAAGIGSGGVSTDIDIAVTGDFLAGRDPQQVYDACIRARTGQGPIRPLAAE